MDFDEIFPWIIMLVLWFVFSRLRQKAESEKKPPKSSSGRTSTPKADVSVSIGGIVKQMLLGGIEPLKPRREERGAAPAPPAQEQEYIEEVLLPEPDLSPAEEPESKAAEVLVAVYEQPSPAGLAVGPVRPDEHGLPPSTGKPSRRKLREAVIWSEILAAPVGLRQEPHE